MIDPAALRKQAANKYAAVVPALLRGESPFPLRLRFPKISTTAEPSQVRRAFELLQAESSEQRPHGLTIRWKTIATRQLGDQRFPSEITLATTEDFFGYIGKSAEWQTIAAHTAQMQAAFPEHTDALVEHWKRFAAGDPAFWDKVITLIRYLAANPFPDCYARELPLGLSSKFLEDHHRLILPLLETLAPHALQAEGETFAERLGLRSPDALIECRLLDETLHPEWRFRQFSLPLSELPTLDTIPAQTVIVTENRVNFLTLPPLPRTLAFHGQGFAVSRLAKAAWLKERRLFYWGDLDTHGFVILGQLRRHFPHTQSVLMNAETLEQHRQLVHEGTVDRGDPTETEGNLTAEEIAAYRHIREKNLRLEQEHLPQAFVVAELQRHIGS
jgi:hypothetical protein